MSLEVSVLGVHLEVLDDPSRLGVSVVRDRSEVRGPLLEFAQPYREAERKKSANLIARELRRRKNEKLTIRNERIRDDDEEWFRFLDLAEVREEANELASFAETLRNKKSNSFSETRRDEHEREIELTISSARMHPLFTHQWLEKG
jgi:hypothetical protein